MPVVRSEAVNAWFRIKVAFRDHPQVLSSAPGKSLAAHCKSLGFPNSNLRRTLQDQRATEPPRAAGALQLRLLAQKLNLTSAFADIDLLAEYRKIPDWDKLSVSSVLSSRMQRTTRMTRIRYSVAAPLGISIIRPYGICQSKEHGVLVVGRLSIEDSDERPCGFIWSAAKHGFFVLPESWINSISGTSFAGYVTTPRLGTSSSYGSSDQWKPPELKINLVMDGLIGSVPSLSQRHEPQMRKAPSPEVGYSRWIRHISEGGLICGYDSVKYQGMDDKCRAFAGLLDSVVGLPTPKGRVGAKAHCVDDAGLIVGYSMNSVSPNDWHPTAWILRESSAQLAYEDAESGFFHHCAGGSFAVGSIFRDGVFLGGVFCFESKTWRLVTELADNSEVSNLSVKLWGCNASGWAVGFCHPRSSPGATEGRALVVPPGSVKAYLLDTVLEGREILIGGASAGVVGKDVSINYCESISESNFIAASAHSFRSKRDLLLIVECRSKDE